jgi:hypothetical protein
MLCICLTEEERMERMNNYELTERLCKELNIDYFHLNTGGKTVDFTEEDYQELKKSILDMYEKQLEKGGRNNG